MPRETHLPRPDARLLVAESAAAALSPILQHFIAKYGEQLATLVPDEDAAVSNPV